MVLTSLHAQKEILPGDKMGEEERKLYNERVGLMNLERARTEPIFIQSAQVAVQRLGAELMKGNVDYAIDNMYPRLKNKLAKLHGSHQKVIEKARAQQRSMQETKTVITDFKAGKPEAVYYVRMERKEGLAKFYYPVDYSFQKLLIVPTTTIIQFAKIDPKTGKPIKVEKNSSQLAIYDDKIKKWTFIDGSATSPNELRGLFPFIPKSVAYGLPKSGKTLNK